MCPTNWRVAAWGRARRRGRSPRRGQGTCRRRGLARGWILANEAFTYLPEEQLVAWKGAPQIFNCNIFGGSELGSFAVRCACVTVCAKRRHSDRRRSKGIWSHSVATPAARAKFLTCTTAAGRRGSLSELDRPVEGTLNGGRDLCMLQACRSWPSGGCSLSRPALA